MILGRTLSVLNGFKFVTAGTIQWAPTLTAHDPNPPITLEDAAASSVIQDLIGLGLLAYPR